MNTNKNRITISFPIEELTNRILDNLCVAEISSPADPTKPHYIGDERQEEFVAAHLRLATWKVCAVLSGWNASTEFDMADNLTLSLDVGFEAEPHRQSLLGIMIRDWLCNCVLLNARRLMSGSREQVAADEEALEQSRQRVLMMLCAADMMRKVG